MEIKVKREPPPPADYQTALEEIARLRRQLNDTNLKWMKAVERRELDNRSNTGTIRAMRETEKLLREEIKRLSKP